MYMTAHVTPHVALTDKLMCTTKTTKSLYTCYQRTQEAQIYDTTSCLSLVHLQCSSCTETFCTTRLLVRSTRSVAAVVVLAALSVSMFWMSIS